MVTTIQIDEKLKEKLDNLKVHYRETYNELISRLVNSSSEKIDKESLTETIEILSDPETMRDIANGLEEYEKGKILYSNIYRKAVELRGTVSAEHGIGKLKTEHLLNMYGEKIIQKMFSIKNILDPNLVLGSGNIFTRN